MKKLNVKDSNLGHLVLELREAYFSIAFQPGDLNFSLDQLMPSFSQVEKLFY